MKLKALIAAATFAGLCSTASAQLNLYEDYDIGEAVWEITPVKVDANMGDYYLEGLRSTWIDANEISKSLGHIEDYKIMGSVTPENGNFNMLLMVKYKSMAEMVPSKEKYDAFMAAWGDAKVDESRETSKTYPELREIKGQYLMQEVMMIEAE
ncbi:MAG: hypothetical protein AAGA72_17885 [Pseudomonadota bacterium]